MFDYIVVGAGSAGCVLAHRLSEDPSCKVLLIEAGGDDTSPLSRIPGAYPQLQDTYYDWGYRTVPQRHLYGRRIFQPRGKVLGGSSAINYMVYIRGNRGDYDHWRDLGNDGWGYEDVLPCFVRMECNQRLQDQYHGSTGPITVSDHSERNPLSDTFIQAAQEIGIRLNSDFNGAVQEGCGYYQMTCRENARCSAADGYLAPISGTAKSRSRDPRACHPGADREGPCHWRRISVADARSPEATCGERGSVVRRSDQFSPTPDAVGRRPCRRIEAARN